ncbi:hypothetical protein KCU61_g620, partial [Aureobasidium melanogenum]
MKTWTWFAHQQDDRARLCPEQSSLRGGCSYMAAAGKRKLGREVAAMDCERYEHRAARAADHADQGAGERHRDGGRDAEAGVDIGVEVGVAVLNRRRRSAVRLHLRRHGGGAFGRRPHRLGEHGLGATLLLLGGSGRTKDVVVGGLALLRRGAALLLRVLSHCERQGLATNTSGGSRGLLTAQASDDGGRGSGAGASASAHETRRPTKEGPTRSTLCSTLSPCPRVPAVKAAGDDECGNDKTVDRVRNWDNETKQQLKMVRALLPLHSPVYLFSPHAANCSAGAPYHRACPCSVDKYGQNILSDNAGHVQRFMRAVHVQFKVAPTPRRRPSLAPLPYRD